MIQNASYCEKHILASIKDNPDLIFSIEEFLSPKNFINEENKNIFLAFKRAINNEAPLDLEYITSKSKDKVSEEALFEIFALTGLPQNQVITLAKELVFLSTKRDLEKASLEFKKITTDESIENRDALLDKAQDIVNTALYSQDSNDKSFSSSEERNNQLLEILKEREASNGYLIGKTYGLKSLDKITTGACGGELIILGGRPAMGKSGLALEIADASTRNNSSCIFFSLEMPDVQMQERHLSMRSGVPLTKIRTGNLQEDDWTPLMHSIHETNKEELYIQYTPNLTVSSLKRQIKKIKPKLKHELGFVIIDYLQLMKGDSKKDRHLEISEISRELKNLAGELDIPILALSQLNRSLESRPDKRPMLSDLRESGSLEQDANVILFVYRDSVYKEKEEEEKRKKAEENGDTYVSTYIPSAIDDVEIIVAKQRQGATGTVHAKYKKECVLFFEEEDMIETVFVNDSKDKKTEKLEMPTIL